MKVKKKKIHHFNTLRTVCGWFRHKNQISLQIEFVLYTIGFISKRDQNNMMLDKEIEEKRTRRNLKRQYHHHHTF